MSNVILETRHLKKYFKCGKNSNLHAVDDINLKIKKGKTLGVVGESGCGKTTLGRTILGLIKATDGEIYFQDENITNLKNRKMKKYRRNMQFIFQDPYSSINPRHRIGSIIGEPLKVNRIITDKKRRKEKVLEIMKRVGLAENLYNKYPHELDGGRRQRVGVARALSVNPKLIICDEPVSALDVSIQAQILNLLMDIQEENDLTYMFITHDLSVVKHISDEIMVIYLGKCVEQTSSDELFNNPLHPYTKALLSSILVPSATIRDQEMTLISGEITSPVDPPIGCRFAGRCPIASEECLNQEIPLIEVEPGHLLSCIKYNKK